MGFIHSQQGLSRMSHCGRLRVALQNVGFDDEIVCPRPQKMDSLAGCPPHIIKPVRGRCSPPATNEEFDAGDEILEIFFNKRAYGKPSDSGCPSPCFSGSPPSRSSNPLIHDLHFIQQSLQTSSVFQPKPHIRSAIQCTPLVRIEGFGCSGCC